ncbi:hypothetical protein [Vibrio splendidus]|uniref:hypothetical protein n=1 Tax=Vibrio splendidus TaxID=29497 RepID=UPI0015E69322|nr:hypothetical protein [Vibrio splendidus]
MNQFTELVGMKSYFQKHLNDPVNWVAFIKENNMSLEEKSTGEITSIYTTP